MKKSYAYRKSMVPSALQAEDAMKDSPIAKRLKSLGFTPADMAAEAKALTALHTKIVAAKTAAGQASAALSKRAAEFAEYWASYCNQVRALTTDTALRAKHGVKSPGMRKGPGFKRGKKAATKPTTPAEPNGAVQVKEEEPSKNATVSA